MKFWYFEHFWRNFQFWPMFYWKTAILRFGPVYEVVVTSYVECLYFIWCVWKEETHIYTIELLYYIEPIRRFWRVQFSVSRGDVTSPLVNLVTEKGLVRRGELILALIFERLNRFSDPLSLQKSNFIPGEIYSIFGGRKMFLPIFDNYFISVGLYEVELVVYCKC